MIRASIKTAGFDWNKASGHTSGIFTGLVATELTTRYLLSALPRVPGLVLFGWEGRGGQRRGGASRVWMCDRPRKQFKGFFPDLREDKGENGRCIAG